MGISRGYINAIMGAGPGADDFWQAVAWTVALLPLMVAALIAALGVGTLATQLVSGGGGGGGMGGIAAIAKKAATKGAA